jgi:hypothetical protein
MQRFLSRGSVSDGRYWSGVSDHKSDHTENPGCLGSLLQRADEQETHGPAQGHLIEPATTRQLKGVRPDQRLARAMHV